MASNIELKEWLKENPLTQDILEKIINRFDLQNIDLYNEKNKIEEKRSYLSARQRKAVLEIVQMKELMNEIKLEKENKENIEKTAVFSTN